MDENGVPPPSSGSMLLSVFPVQVAKLLSLLPIAQEPHPGLVVSFSSGLKVR
jgi:hypothetical protein